MNIDDLTIGEAKQLAAIFQSKPEGRPGFFKDYIGKFVICRTRNEGVNAGTVKLADETGVVLTNARRIYRHWPKDKSLSWYEGVAVSGLSENSVVSGTVPEKMIIEDYSLTVCTAGAQTSIMEHTPNAQS